MLCKKCREVIETGEAMRAEPVHTGSQHYHFYHTGCYAAVKQERQSEDQMRLPLDDQPMVTAARSVC